MIAAPQSQDTRPPAREAAPNSPSKAGMMIAAYRAARLNQRLTLRSTPLAQQDHQPPAAPDCEAGRPRSNLPFDIATIREGKGTDQIAGPDAAPLAMTMTEQVAEAASAHPETATIGQETAGPAELVSGPAPTREEPVPEQDDIALAQPSCSSFSFDRAIQTSGDAASSHRALAEIGLGPCMRLRLNQIGVKSIHDVAQAKPDDLRAALGSSSRLLNVEAWISTARHLTATGCAA